MAGSVRDIMDEEGKLHADQERQRWLSGRNYRRVEAHYRERLLALMADLGYGETVRVMPAQAHHDLEVGGLRVELKFARAHGHPQGYHRERYQAILKDPSRRHSMSADVLLFVAVDADELLFPYLIPTGDLGGAHWLSITSHPLSYRGRWAAYLHRWSYLDA